MRVGLAYGFLDESPSLSDTSLFFCVDIISTNDKTNKRLKNIVKRARKRIVKKKLKHTKELKFHTSDEKTREFVLTEIAKEDVVIVAVAIDKEGRRIKDTPQNYGIVVGSAIAETASLFPLLNLTVDKKFTAPAQEQKYIAEAQKTAQLLVDRKGSLNLAFNAPVDSMADSNVQLADFIAGALNMKYNGKDEHYVEIIKLKIKIEKVLKWTEIKKRIVNP